MPHLDPDNEVIWRIFDFAKSQLVVAGMGSVLGIQFSAIDRGIKHYDVPRWDRRRVFDGVRTLGEIWSRMLSDKQQAMLPADQRRTTAQPDMPPLRTKKVQQAIEDRIADGDNGVAV